MRGTWLGICFNAVHPYKEEMYLRLAADMVRHNISVIRMADLDLLDMSLDLLENDGYERVVIYDYEELGSWDRLKEFALICHSYNKNWSILKQDIHSDVAVEAGYFLENI